MNVNLMQKDYDCPICAARFKAPRPRTAKLKLIGVDNDLRPYHEDIDTVLYEIVVCTNCGYTAHNKNFEEFDSIYVEKTKKGIENIKPQKTFYSELTIEDAIDRYFSAIQLLEYKKTKDSEYYFLYSRLSWVYRSLSNIDALENEYLSIKKAFVYLEKAYKIEQTPFFGMDESTVIFVLAETARRISDFDKANLYVGKSILDPKSNEDLRERAKETKLYIANDAEKVQKMFNEIEEELPNSEPVKVAKPTKKKEEPKKKSKAIKKEKPIKPGMQEKTVRKEEPDKKKKK